MARGGNRNGSGRNPNKRKRINQTIRKRIGKPPGSLDINHFNHTNQITIVPFTEEETQRIMISGTPLELSEWDIARLKLHPVLIKELWMEKWKRERSIRGSETIEKKFENLMMHIYEFVESKGLVTECDQWVRRHKR